MTGRSACLCVGGGGVFGRGQELVLDQDNQEAARQERGPQGETLMRILLVEDEAPLRETLAARLKRDGFAVDAAQDGEEGIYLGREVPFDLAIIDLGLPKMSGMDLVKALREHGQRYPRSEEHTSELQSLMRN